MSDVMDQLARMNGFKDGDELGRMVAAVPLASPGMMERFLRWKNDDGSKAGLEELLGKVEP